MRVSARLLASAALLSVLGTQSVFSAGAQASQSRFSPPNLPMVLSRTVIRELSGGAQSVVKRRFRVQFQRDGEGFVLTGTPIDVSVDVPPILLDGQGLMHPAVAPNNTDADARKRGQQAANTMIGAAAMPEMRKREGDNCWLSWRSTRAPRNGRQTCLRRATAIAVNIAPLLCPMAVKAKSMCC